MSTSTASSTVHDTSGGRGRTAPPGPRAAGARVTTGMGTPVSVDLITDPAAARTGALVVTGFTQAAHGRVTLLGPRAIYTPSPGYSGEDGFRYTISDASGRSSTGRIIFGVAAFLPSCTITISGPSSVLQGTAIHLTADARCNAGTPEIQWLHRLAGGSFTVFKSFSTASSADYATTSAPVGDHQFLARVRIQGTTTRFSSNLLDVLVASSTAPCTAVVLDAPSAGAVFATGQPITLHGTASCPDGSVPEYQYRVKQPADAEFTVLPGYFPGATSYTPPRPGDWVFVATARSAGSSDPFQVQSDPVTVGVSQAPTAVDDTLVIDEDTSGAVDVLANDSDPEGDALTAVITAPPVAGTATVSAGVITYAPAADYNGSDEIGYTIDDGHGNTATATVHVTINPVEDMPSAHHDFVTVPQGGSVSLDVTENDTDVDGDPLTLIALSPPAHGTATFTGNVVTYTPDPGFSGDDTFEYTISDPLGEQSVAGVFVTVTPGNQPPVAVDDQLTTAEDTEGGVYLLGNDSDPEGGGLTVIAFDQPAHGSVSVVAGLASYIPDPDYNGPDAFGYTVQDSAGATATATVQITVTPVDDPPVARDDSATVAEDTAATIDAVADDSDVDGDALAITAVTQPAHGTAAIVDASHVVYTPAPDYNGPDAFGYTVDDGNGGQASAAIAVTVTAVNDPPVARGDVASVAEDGSAVIDVVANDSDVDGDALAVVEVAQPAHGAVAIADPHHVAYTPAPNYHGGDAFSYTITDPSGAQATALVAIDVTAVNDPPVARGDVASVAEDGSAVIDVVANDLDVDGDALAITAVAQPAHGLALLIDDHHVRYVPAPDYHGGDALSYTISDGSGGEASAQLVLDVVAVNDPPVAVGDAAGLDEDTPATIDVVGNDSDVDGDTLAVAGVTQPAHGTAAITGLHDVRYTPAADYNGADSFQYTIDDGHGGQATAQVTLAVAAVNDPPVAVGDAAALDEDTTATIDVVGNDSDVDGDTLAVAGVTQPAHGAAAIVDAGHVSYTPAADYSGADSFQYTVDDGHGGQATAQVTLAVAAVNDPPVAAAGALDTFDDTPATAVLSASDADGDPLAFAIATPPVHGTLGAVAGDRVSYTPEPGYVGGDAFSFIASDGRASSAPATIQITVVHAVCGNGVREGVHEECDDGNATPGDGCESSCRLSCGSGTGAERATVDAASGHCFAAYDGVRHSYQEAAAMCGALGGHLPTITSAGEDAAAFAAVSPGDAPWLGADDVATEGTFRWITGEPFAGYSHFAPGKPDDAGNADCLRYLADGTWSDAPCGGGPGLTGTLCELELAVTTPAVATGGGGTRAVAVADLDGDGRADIAALNPANSTVGVLRGDGAGGFAVVATYATGSGPIALAAGDLDGDGDVDLVVASATAGTIGVLLGDGGGGFVAGPTLAIAAGATALALADLDGDGALDLAVTATGTVQVLRGNGSGGFSLLGAVQVTGAPAAVAAGDFDRDGALDLALATPTAVLVARGTGGGAFATPTVLSTAIGNRAIVASDLDGDGNLDLAVAGGTAITVWFGTGTGAFDTPSSLTVAAAPQAVAAADFDGDGGRDLVAVTGGYAVLFHGAGRTFTAAGAPVATGGSGASFAVAASIDGDAAADLVVANAGSSSAGILLGGTGGFGGARALPAGTGATATLSADFNEDGRGDLAVIDPATSKVYVFVQTATGALVPSATLATPANGGASYGAVADFDGDGHLDLAVVNVAFSSVSILLGTGTGTFGAPQNAGVAASPRRLAVGDFNGDGRPDLAVPAANSNVVSILINTGFGRFGRVGDQAAGAAPAAAVVGDFNGDGKKDIAVACSGEASVKLLIGHGDSTFSAAVSFPVAAAGSSIAAGDVDGDGKLDLVQTSTAASSLSLLVGTGAGGFAAFTSLPVGGQPAAVLAVDLDGDTRLDLVVGNAGSNDVTVLHGAGPGGFVASSFGVGVAPGWLTAADLDRDGHLDIAAASGSGFATLLYSGR